jgi:glutathione S-transferase
MTDTSPIIDWFETQCSDPKILPEDPVQAYFCRLIDDYADEWLWRPAMHFRWSYPVSAKLLARQIVDEMAGDVPAPGWVKRMRTERRQRFNFVERDGVNDTTRAHVEESYFKLLRLLTDIFDDRPFLFGGRPTLADIGLFGPFFRHFAMDPKPAVIMRETASAVMEWVYRIWNARASRLSGDLISGIPDDLLPLLREIGETHLESLCANATAWKAGHRRYAATVQGVTYRDLQTSRYRVWCLEKLQERYRALAASDRDAVTVILKAQGGYEPLMRIEEPNSGYDPDGTVPFGKSLPVFEEIKG